MLKLYFVFCCTVLGCVFSSVTWDYSRLEVNQGDVFTVSCSVTPVRVFDVVRVELRRDSDPQPLTIADGPNVKQVFSQTERYTVVYKHDAPTARIIISYDGVRGEDSGNLTCYTLSDRDNAAVMQLRVLVPVKDVFLMSLNDAGSATRLDTAMESKASPSHLPVIQLREIEELGLVCVVIVEGSLIAPNVTVSVGGMDVTEFFYKNVESMTIPGMGASSAALHKLGLASDGPAAAARPAGLRNLGPAEQQVGLRQQAAAAGMGLGIQLSTVKLTLMTMQPERTWNNQVLTCSASASLSSVSTVSALLSVEYAPVVSCATYEHFVTLGHSATITCEVSAFPNASVLWMRADSTSGSLLPVLQSEDIKITVHDIPSSRDRQLLELSLTSVALQQLGLYLLVAENVIGRSDVTLVLYPAVVPQQLNPFSQSAVVAAESGQGQQSPLSSAADGGRGQQMQQLQQLFQQQLEAQNQQSAGSQQQQQMLAQQMPLDLMLMMSANHSVKLSIPASLLLIMAFLLLVSRLRL